MTITNQNYICKKLEEQIEFREYLLSSVRHVLSSHFITKNVEIKICETMILFFVLFECVDFSYFKIFFESDGEEDIKIKKSQTSSDSYK
jgi:hypothetical protein